MGRQIQRLGNWVAYQEARIRHTWDPETQYLVLVLILAAAANAARFGWAAFRKANYDAGYRAGKAMQKLEAEHQWQVYLEKREQE